MLVLDRSHALESMLWLSQRARIAVPKPYQRPPAPDAIITPNGRRAIASQVILRPAHPVIVDPPPASADAPTLAMTGA